MKWYNGTITLEAEFGNDGSTMDAAVCFDVPGMVLYQTAGGMGYAVPLSRVVEVTFENPYPLEKS
jgi:hypothetical protein